MNTNIRNSSRRSHRIQHGLPGSKLRNRRCFECARQKVRCLEGVPCQRCVRLCLRCVFQPLEKPQPFLDLAFTMIEPKILSGMYMQVFHSMLAENLVDRERLRSRLALWRRLSVKAQHDLSYGLISDLCHAAHISPVELETHDEVMFDVGPRKFGPEEDDCAAEREDLKRKLSSCLAFQVLDDGVRFVLFFIYTPQGFGLVMNDGAGELMCSTAELTEYISHKILGVHLMACCFAREDRALWYRSHLMVSFCNKKEPCTEFVKFCSRSGQVELYILRSQYMYMPDVSDIHRVEVVTMEKAPVSKHLVKRPGRRNCVIDAFKDGPPQEDEEGNLVKQEHRQDPPPPAPSGPPIVPGMACLPVPGLPTAERRQHVMESALWPPTSVKPLDPALLKAYYDHDHHHREYRERGEGGGMQQQQRDRDTRTAHTSVSSTHTGVSCEGVRGSQMAHTGVLGERARGEVRIRVGKAQPMEQQAQPPQVCEEQMEHSPFSPSPSIPPPPRHHRAPPLPRQHASPIREQYRPNVRQLRTYQQPQRPIQPIPPPPQQQPQQQSRHHSGDGGSDDDDDVDGDGGSSYEGSYDRTSYGEKREREGEEEEEDLERGTVRTTDPSHDQYHDTHTHTHARTPTHAPTPTHAHTTRTPTHAHTPSRPHDRRTHPHTHTHTPLRQSSPQSSPRELQQQQQQQGTRFHWQQQQQQQGDDPSDAHADRYRPYQPILPRTHTNVTHTHPRTHAHGYTHNTPATTYPGAYTDTYSPEGVCTQADAYGDVGAYAHMDTHTPRGGPHAHAHAFGGGVLAHAHTVSGGVRAHTPRHAHTDAQAPNDAYAHTHTQPLDPSLYEAALALRRLQQGGSRHG